MFLLGSAVPHFQKVLPSRCFNLLLSFQQGPAAFRRLVKESVLVQLQLSGIAGVLLFAVLAHETGYRSTSTQQASLNGIWALCCVSCNVTSDAERKIPTKSNSERWRSKSASRVVLIAYSSCNAVRARAWARCAHRCSASDAPRLPDSAWSMILWRSSVRFHCTNRWQHEHHDGDS